MKFILSVVLVYSFIRGYEGIRENKVADVIFKFYNGNTMSQFVDAYLPNSVSLLTAPGFDISSPTVLYIHGFSETTKKESIQTVISAYLETFPNSNIILLDWSNMANGTFTNAASNTKLVGPAVAAEIKGWVNGGLNQPGIHVVAHSLGSHVAGYIGRNLIGYNMKLKRITTLDPAFPLFYPSIFLQHITASDADFVDIIHTDAGWTGAPVHTGTVDFWPNGGHAFQPGCLTTLPNPDDPFVNCNHARSWRFWSESLRYPTNFPSVSYDSWGDFKSDSHFQNKTINYMGINADITISGDFYLQTNGRSLFGKGVPGTVYQN